MKKSFILAFCCFTLFFGCSSKKNVSGNNEYSADKIRQLINNAAAGNTIANEKLGNLFDYTLPIPSNYNNLVLDSLTFSGKKYYFVLLEHQNPVYNRLAIYDNQLVLYLIDKSLNGSLEAIEHPGFYSIKESFITKDTLIVERVSLYRINDSSAALTFRSFTKLIMPGIEYNQHIDELSEERIKTSIVSSEVSPINHKGDIFSRDNTSGMFRSEADIFNRFVLDEINNFNIKTNKPQITDRRSALESVGITMGVDSADSAHNSRNPAGYSLTLDDTWKELRNISISNHLNRTFKGTRYLNNNLGASICIVSMDEDDSAEMFIDYQLNNVSEGKYKLRFSEKIEASKNFIRFLEYSCGSNKYLVIFEASKYTYNKYQSTYEDIFNTFYMEC